ncbi:hypothetical protein IMG5_105940 [Ichthyophthirius multifiliis]|uniref:Protein kinase domain-containing protein n=1 Tax=Ichthyophthirius multifiliis TaxID=5932 RepID=G0QT37_ICHMU|nr:hypothetical protein IMG5_105940 [Ichthyophthirius multifiliis]EGR31612.1 hypothetical protein IMG5_105940 [Ichthyophthirius multifiliis]|eukprot:XP_004035098.1 hypothetical protein IMG5_105940 [Ichthyophthirius multifiliis]
MHQKYIQKKQKKYKKQQSVLKDSIENQLQLEHLINERNGLRELQNNCINKLIDTIKDDTHLHFLLEIVYGIPLHKLLQMHQRFTINFTKLIICQVILTIQYMHLNGFIYRDLKASNIIVQNTGKITIIDLGYIKKIGINRTNSFCGTIHMIAPELFDINLEQKGYSYETDIYSIGILLYEMIVGYIILVQVIKFIIYLVKLHLVILMTYKQNKIFQQELMMNNQNFQKIFLYKIQLLKCLILILKKEQNFKIFQMMIFLKIQIQN